LDPAPNPTIMKNRGYQGDPLADTARSAARLPKYEDLRTETVRIKICNQSVESSTGLPRVAACADTVIPVCVGMKRPPATGDRFGVLSMLLIGRLAPAVTVLRDTKVLTGNLRRAVQALFVIINAFDAPLSITITSDLCGTGVAAR
jgi:hypothetical protein